MTRRGVGLVTASAVSWLFARLFGIDELHTAATATALLVLVGVLWVVVPLRLTGTLVVRPAFLAVDEEAVARLTLRNAGVLPTPALEVVLRTPAACEVGPAPPTVVAPRSSRDLDLRLRARRRGVHTLGPVEALRRDPFGIAARRTVLQVSDVVTVTPTITALQPPLKLNGGPGETARAARRVPGMGTDFVEIRPYLPGDDLRGVHWPSTAHRGELMIRRVEEPRAPRAAVFVDTRATGFPTGDAARFEQAVALAASIAVHLLERGVDVTILDGQRAVTDVADPRRALLRGFAELVPTSEPLHRVTDRLAAQTVGIGTLIAVLPTPRPADLPVWQTATRSVPQRIAIVLADDATSAATSAVDRLRRAGWQTTAAGPGESVSGTWHALLTTSVRVAR